MNWLERARHEIRETAGDSNANRAEGVPTTVTAVPARPNVDPYRASFGSNGSALPAFTYESESESFREAFEERTAIMEFDGGLNRDDAERAAWALVTKLYRLH